MIIDTRTLPTPLAKCAARLNAIGAQNSGDTFLATSYLAEAAIKMIAVVLQVSLRERAPSHAYRIAYDLVRADGLGAWESAIRECTSEPLLGFVSQDCTELAAWATKKRNKPEDEWCRQSRLIAVAILARLGVPEESSARAHTVRELVTALVQIRNKTKAHGAVGPDFFADVNEQYIDLVKAFIVHCPVFSWQWFHLLQRDKGSVRAVRLQGEGPQHIREADAVRYRPEKPGVHFVPAGRQRQFNCADLLRSNREYTRLLLPNGGYDGRGRAEFIDYGTGHVAKEDVGTFVAPPVLPPSSETQGQAALDVQGNAWANLPPQPRGYINRPRLESELQDKLSDRNHAIITLHGRGGMGKTMLALNAAHEMSRQAAPRFGMILWFSARDVDLRPSGPAFVRPSVVDLQDVSKAYSELTDSQGGIEHFAQALQSPGEAGLGTLFIFDNFETMTGIADLHQFLDAHTHLPNKTLITSRERAFKADYPIEVKGMEFAEAEHMLRALARELGVEGVATDEVIKSIYEHTEGHAYLMRVVLGEVAKEGRYVPPRQLVSRRIEIVDAVFDRSFDKLSDAGRYVFLVVSNWKSAVPAMALIVVLGDLDLDVESGIDECLRLSLINRDYLLDGQPCYSAPLLARLFGQKKLLGDPDKLVIQAQLETVRRFGVVDIHSVGRKSQVELTEQFVEWCCDPDGASQHSIAPEKVESILQSLAEMWPPGWLALARYRQRKAAPRQSVEHALRRAVEEMPDSKRAWMARADYAELVGDEPIRISSLIAAVEADPNDVELLTTVAVAVTRYVSDHASQIPSTRRGVYLASVRQSLERVADQLSADGLSKLSWLFLLENNHARAREYATKGLKREPQNAHCLNILEKLSSIPA